MSLRKENRLKEFIRRLEKSPLVSSSQEAFALISETLNDVEDEHTNIPHSPNKWMDDGRMYPPQEDSKRDMDNLKITRYRNKGHYTDIGDNGSFRIREVRGNKSILIDKEGADKQKVGDL